MKVVQAMTDVKIYEDQEYYYFVVSDNGKGFDNKYDSKSSKDGGYGLFSINERLDSMHGHLKIESGEKQGTKITVSIPTKNN